MTKVYITFGQEHVHSYNGKTFDKDCVGIVYGRDYSAARHLAFGIFSGVFATSYSEDEWKKVDMALFPRGFIEVNSDES